MTIHSVLALVSGESRMPSRSPRVSSILLYGVALFLSAVASLAAHAQVIGINWPPSPVERFEVARAGDTLSFRGDFASINVIPTDSTFAVSAGPPVALPSSGSGLTFPPVATFPTSGVTTLYFAATTGGFSNGTPLTIRPDLGKLTVIVLPRCPTPPAVSPVMDIDGDGVVKATTDGTLLTRYALGMRGDALVANVLGTNASRCTAYDIEQYLAPRTMQ
ncbi:MAG: hypothetical protein ACRDAM_11230 [Casimicrobium sp.]